MNDVMGIIYTGENDARLRELSVTRAVAAMPIAARYRVIDFLVSSMVNGGIRNVGVIMQKNYHSLMDHLGSGKEWDLHGKINGLHILPPFLTRENVGVYSGTLDAIRSNTNYLIRSKQELVVFSNSEIIYNVDMGEVINAHEQSGADITLMYTRSDSLRREEHGTYITVDADNRVTEMEIAPTKPSLECTSMKVMVLKKELLRSLVDRAVAHGLHELDKDVLMPLIQTKQCIVKGFEYKGPCWRIDSVQSYFRFNLDILDPAVRKQILRKDLPVYTKVRDEMPTYYGNDSRVVNSLVADGCVIEGSVENSILFRGVHIDAGAKIKNCVIMQDGHVSADAYIENCIMDKNSTVKRNAKLIGPESYPIVIAKDIVI